MYALHRAKVVMFIDSNFDKIYEIAMQSSIEIGRYADANIYFLFKPAFKITHKPIQRNKNPILPDKFVAPLVVGAGNDCRHILEQASIFKSSSQPYTKTVSVVVPVYNRHKILANTLAALLHQTYNKELIEIIVADDGSSDEVLSVIKKYEKLMKLYYVRQEDKGYRLASTRNLGFRVASGEVIVVIDADILPCPKDIEHYMQVMHVSDNAVLIGHRRYVDTSKLSDTDIMHNIELATSLPDIIPNNDVAITDDKINSNKTVADWRYATYEKTNYLIDDLWPFTKASGGNIAFSRVLLDKTGYADEDFNDWGCEDGEHGYRMYNSGAYFISMLDIVSLHQEPVNYLDEEHTNSGESFRAKGHKITKKILANKCPIPIVRAQHPVDSNPIIYNVPKVSIYIPAYNADKYIVAAVNSCLQQLNNDLEVCICNDGSTDKTLELLEQNFSFNLKVRWISQTNKGIGSATNAAINLCRGMYIAQLDSDDLLKTNAIQILAKILDQTNVDAVYADCDYIDSNGEYVRDGWCGGEFSKNWMMTNMIATHFRMLKKRVWNRITKCNTNIKNAVDLDLWLKINEQCNIQHVHKILYSY